MEGLAAQIAELAGSPGALERLGLDAHRTIQQGYAMDAYVDRFSAIVGGASAAEPIRTSDEMERILACVLPLEADAAVKVANLRSYIDWQLDSQSRYFNSLNSQFQRVDSQLANLRLVARLERFVAPTGRRLTRALRPGR
jgi:hypothetical protein